MEREKLSQEIVENVANTINLIVAGLLLNSREDHVLMLLDDAGGKLFPNQISKSLNVTMPRVTTILNGLENKKLVTRKISDEDRRKIEVTITKKGRESIRSRKNVITEALENITCDMNESELNAVLKFISEMDRMVKDEILP